MIGPSGWCWMSVGLSTSARSVVIVDQHQHPDRLSLLIGPFVLHQLGPEQIPHELAAVAGAAVGAQPVPDPPQRSRSETVKRVDGARGPLAAHRGLRVPTSERTGPIMRHGPGRGKAGETERATAARHPVREPALTGGG